MTSVNLNTINVGDVVDVDMEYEGIYRVRVLELLDDVSDHSGLDPEPGFVGKIEHATHDPPNEGSELVFGVSHIVPGSKAKYFFPDLGDEIGEDEYGRVVQNPYRDMASRRKQGKVGELKNRYGHTVIFEANGYVELPGDEIRDLIVKQPAGAIAPADYVDSTSGEIMWEKGQRAGSTSYHPESIEREREERRSKIYIDAFDGDEWIWEFESKYDVRHEDLGRVVGEPEVVAATDSYDLEQPVPVSISRSDGTVMSTNDIDNARDYVELWNDLRTPVTGVELYLYKARGELSLALDHGLVR